MSALDDFHAKTERFCTFVRENLDEQHTQALGIPLIEMAPPTERLHFVIGMFVVKSIRDAVHSRNLKEVLTALSVTPDKQEMAIEAFENVDDEVEDKFWRYCDYFKAVAEPWIPLIEAYKDQKDPASWVDDVGGSASGTQ